MKTADFAHTTVNILTITSTAANTTRKEMRLFMSYSCS